MGDSNGAGYDIMVNGSDFWLLSISYYGINSKPPKYDEFWRKNTIAGSYRLVRHFPPFHFFYISVGKKVINSTFEPWQESNSEKKREREKT